ncbi:TRAP transporter substrate-binding protein DctP [Bacteroidota bacterium]
MRKLVYLLLVVVVVVGLLLASCAKPAPGQKAEPINLKFVWAWAPQFIENDMNQGFIDEVNEKAKGELIIEHIGGPEVIPPFDQSEAVRSGAVDMHYGTHAYYLSTVPDNDVSKLWADSGAELRKKGIYDLLDKIHQEKLNAKLLGLMSTPLTFQFYSRIPVRNPKDIVGMKIRVSPYYTEFVKALGGVPTVIAPPEVYTALERGAVDGLCWPTAGMIEAGFAEQVKYIVGPPFYRYTGFFTMNLDKWNSLPPNLQKVVTNAMIEKVEKACIPHYQKLVDDERDRLLKLGLQVIEFSPEDDKWFVDLAYKAAWDTLLEKAPQYGPELKKLIED